MRYAHDGLERTRIASLPARTLTVSFLAGTTPQTHTETGPRLDTVLGAAGINPLAVAWVAAVASDGYVATVTPAKTGSAAVHCCCHASRTASC